MSKDVLRVRATGKGLVQDYERLESGTNAFIGRKFVELKDQPGKYGFEPTGDVVEVPFRVEYVKALQTGDLEAADAETAKRAGVKFESKAAARSPQTTSSSTPPRSALREMPADGIEKSGGDPIVVKPGETAHGVATGDGTGTALPPIEEDVETPKEGAKHVQKGDR